MALYVSAALILGTRGPTPLLDSPSATTFGRAAEILVGVGAFEADPVAGRADGIRFQAINSVAVLVILILMIWKPGA